MNKLGYMPSPSKLQAEHGEDCLGLVIEGWIDLVLRIDVLVTENELIILEQGLDQLEDEEIAVVLNFTQVRAFLAAGAPVNNAGTD